MPRRDRRGTEEQMRMKCVLVVLAAIAAAPFLLGGGRGADGGEADTKIALQGGYVPSSLPPGDIDERPGDLYVLAIGINDYPGDFKDLFFSENDATAISEALDSVGSAVFDHVYSYTLLGENATREGIQAAVQEIASRSRTGDTFVFFFSGRALPGKDPLSGGTELYLLPSDILQSWDPEDAAASNALSTRLLLSWGLQIQATNQCWMFDTSTFDGGTGVVTSYLSAAAELQEVDGSSVLTRNIVILAPAGDAWDITILDNEGGGLFSMGILQGLAGEADGGGSADGIITAKELDAYLASYTTKDLIYSTMIESYSRGRDFPLGKVEVIQSTDDQAPEILITAPAQRGSKPVATVPTVRLEGYAIDESGIAKVTVNGEDVQFLGNGKFTAALLLNPGANTIRITATDKRGNTAALMYAIEYKEPDPNVARQGKDYALIFATDDYDSWGDLKNPIFDAQAIATDLSELYGFDTDIVQNPALDTIHAKLREYARKEFKEDDQLLIFFAGHGDYDELDNDGYIVATNSDLNDEYKRSYMAFSVLRNKIDNIPCKHILITLDVCFGGTFSGKIGAGDRGNDPTYDPAKRNVFIRRQLKWTTRKYLTSGGKEYVPDGRPGRHSPFAKSFLDALRTLGGEDRILTMNELLAKVETVTPEPRYGNFGKWEAGSGFLFIAEPGAIASRER